MTGKEKRCIIAPMNHIILARHEEDAKNAFEVSKLGMHYPLDIPSLERQIWHGIEEPFLSDGYTWRDKPHQAMDKAINEIRRLRKLLIEKKS